MAFSTHLQQVLAYLKAGHPILPPGNAVPNAMPGSPTGVVPTAKPAQPTMPTTAPRGGM